MARLEKGNKTQVPQGQEQAFDEIVENLNLHAQEEQLINLN